LKRAVESMMRGRAILRKASASDMSSQLSFWNVLHAECAFDSGIVRAEQYPKWFIDFVVQTKTKEIETGEIIQVTTYRWVNTCRGQVVVSFQGACSRVVTHSPLASAARV